MFTNVKYEMGNTIEYNKKKIVNFNIIVCLDIIGRIEIKNYVA